MRKVYILLTAMLLAISAVLMNSCSKEKSPFPTIASPMESPMGPEITPQLVENYLKEFALTMAETMQDLTVLALIHEEIGKKFDGQFETLYRHVANKNVSDNVTFVKKLEQSRESLIKSATLKKPSLQETTLELDAITRLLESKMNVQLFMPFYPQWDGATPPLVAYLPQDIDDNDIKEFNAFDCNGNSIVIPVDRAQEYQYIIVGANERTDQNGELLPNLIYQDQAFVPEMEQSLAKTLEASWDIPGPGPRPDGWESRLYRVRIINDMEPYVTNGDPEIAIKFKPFKGFGSNEIYFGFDNCFDGHWHFLIHHDWDATWYYTTCTILSHWWQADFSNYIAFCVYERDGGEATPLKFEVSYGGVKFSTSFEIDNGDDILYKSYIDWADENYHDYISPNAVLKICYREP